MRCSFKRVACAAVLVLMFHPINCAAQQQPDAQVDLAKPFFTAAQKFQEEDKHDLAIQELTTGLKKAPGDVKLLSARAWSLSVLGKFNESLADYNQILKAEPNFASAYVGRSALYIFMKQYDKAFADADRAIKMGHEDVASYNNRGRANCGLKQYAKAVDDLTAAINLDATCNQPYYFRALAYEALNERKKALADYAKCLELSKGMDVRVNPNDQVDYLRSAMAKVKELESQKTR